MNDPDPPDVPGSREVMAHIEATVVDRSTQALSIAVARGYRADEHLEVTLDGAPVSIEEIAGPHGARVHLLRDVSPGTLVVDYRATVHGSAPAVSVDDVDWLASLRPSRYCESDRIGAFARSEFGGSSAAELLERIPAWVAARVRYVPGVSRPIDGAAATMLAGEGVCRDFAHLTCALLRANDVAARMVSVYAPGLDPMDFHAVTEAVIDGRWCVVDPTGLAPRQSLVRIATGADAAETAFMTTIGGRVDLTGIEVGAVAQPSLPFDDVRVNQQIR